MVSLLAARILEFALHFAILGGLADVALQLHHGQLRDAIIHAVIASICIVVIAGASYIAKSLLGKHHSDLQLNVTWSRTKKTPAKAPRSVKRVTRGRRSL